MDLDCAASDFGDGIVHHYWRRNCDALVELAAAAAVRMAPDYVLAGARTAASLPDSVWRVGGIRGRKGAHASPHKRTHGGTNGRTHAGTVGKDDPRGTREIPPGTPRLLGYGATAGIEDKCLSGSFLFFKLFLQIER